MKKNKIFMVALLLSSNVFSQTLKVNESTERIGTGTNTALVVYIPAAKPDDIEKEWKSLMKDFKSEKISGKDGVFADNIIIPSITDGTIDVYARAEKIKEGETKFIVGFDMGGAYLSSAFANKLAYEAANKMVADFARKITKNAIAEKLEDAEKAFDKLKSEQKDLEEKKSDLNKDIENYKSKISKAEDDIAKNKTEQEKKKAEIETQRKVVDDISVQEKKFN